MIALPYLSLLTTIFHEQAHIKKAAKYGVKMTYEPDILLRIPHFFQSLKPKPTGIARFQTNLDKEKYLSLGVNEKREILMAGINSDIFFMIMITFVLFTLVGFLIFVKDRKLLDNVSLLSIILIIWLLYEIWSTFQNLTHPNGDLTFLIKSVLFRG
jgi:hypothetical protein